MKLEINLDLQAIIGQATSAERLQPLVDKAIGEALKAALQDATGYSSPFRKELTAQLQEAMPHGLRIEDVAKFQLMVNQAVTHAVQGANAATMQAAITAGIQSAMPEVPASVKLSELIDKARKGFHKEPYQGFYARLELTDYGFADLYLDSDEDCRSKSSARTRINISKVGQVYNMRLDGQELKPLNLPTVIGHWEGLLLAMYVGRTTVTIDMDADEVEYAAQGKED